MNVLLVIWAVVIHELFEFFFVGDGEDTLTSRRVRNLDDSHSSKFFNPKRDRRL